MLVDLRQSESRIQALDVPLEETTHDDLFTVRPRSRWLEPNDAPDLCGSLHDRHLKVNVGGVAVASDDVRFVEPLDVFPPAPVVHDDASDGVE